MDTNTQPYHLRHPRRAVAVLVAGIALLVGGLGYASTLQHSDPPAAQHISDCSSTADMLYAKGSIGHDRWLSDCLSNTQP